NLPGLTITDKDAIAKFEKTSGLDGSFSAVIESASSGYNLNMILQPFAPKPSASASPSPSPTTPAPAAQPPAAPNPSPTPSAGPFDPAAARKSLSDYLTNLLTNKVQLDEDFANDHRDFRMEDFMDGLAAWADPSYNR